MLQITILYGRYHWYDTRHSMGHIIKLIFGAYWKSLVNKLHKWKSPSIDNTYYIIWVEHEKGLIYTLHYCHKKHGFTSLIMLLSNQYLKQYPLVSSGKDLINFTDIRLRLSTVATVQGFWSPSPFFQKDAFGNGSFSSINNLTLEDFCIKGTLVFTINTPL